MLIKKCVFSVFQLFGIPNVGYGSTAIPNVGYGSISSDRYRLDNVTFFKTGHGVKFPCLVLEMVGAFNTSMIR